MTTLSVVRSEMPEGTAGAKLGSTMSERKRAILEHAEGVAETREKWRARNKAYYDDDVAYMRFLIPEGARILDLGCGTGTPLADLNPSRGVGIDFSEAMVAEARRRYPHLEFYVADVEDLTELEHLIGGPFDYIVMSDTLGFLDDCQTTLEKLHVFCDHETRIVVAYYSQLWEPVLRFGEIVGLKMPQPEVNFLSAKDIQNILHLSGFEPIKVEWRQLVPRRWLGLGTTINRYLGTCPLIRKLCLRHYVVARSLQAENPSAPSATVVIPCRNEKGNIESVVSRLPRFCNDMEVIYIEGNSWDGTFEECERVRDAYADKWDIKVCKQQGNGIRDALHTGFSRARGDIVITLDADLTVPPEDTPKFYNAVAQGKGEFVHGTRLIYPMEAGAMRLLNYWGNCFFAAFFSYLLNQRITDTLCGTKAFTRSRLQRVLRDQEYFKAVDPYGGFEVTLCAAKCNLKILEIPIRYADRTYGAPQINRFRDGWKLLRTALSAWRKMKAL